MRVRTRIIFRRVGPRDIVAVSLVMIALFAISIFQLHVIISSMRPRIGTFRLDLLMFLFISVLIGLAHEGIHVALMKGLGVQVQGFRLVKILKVPVAFMILYREARIWQYLMISLGPQLLSIALLVASLASGSYVLSIPNFYEGPLWLLLFMLYMVHIASSAGDLYGSLDLLIKARTLRGTLRCIIRDGRVHGVLIYIGE